MKKSGLKEVKKDNMRLLMNDILEKQSVSRIELSELSGLSPSTVSALVAELMNHGWVVETGVAASTGGRKRTELSINSEKGFLAILDIGWRHVDLHILDLNLKEVYSMVVSDYYITGNELLEKVEECMREQAENICSGHLAGVGLLFQEDMKSSDFNVMYSTSLSSATISLREAFQTQFKVPIIEEYTQIYSFQEIVKREKNSDSMNSAHIEIGKKIFISITSNGKILDMAEGKKADMTPFVEQQPNKTSSERLQEGIMQIMQILCMLFCIDTVYLSGRLDGGEQVAEEIVKEIKQRMTVESRITVKAMKPLTNHIKKDLGKRVLEKIIVDM